MTHTLRFLPSTPGTKESSDDKQKPCPSAAIIIGVFESLVLDNQQRRSSFKHS